MKRILLIDDDQELSEMLREYLVNEGYVVECAHDGQAGVQQVLEGSFDLVVLDIMLPKLDGITVLRTIRHSLSLPVIMLTAKGDDVDRIVGLEIGADDYLSKPCNPRELLARIRAVLRRTQESSDTGKPKSEMKALVCGELTIDPGSRTASYREKSLDLTSTEFNLLVALVRKAGEVVSKKQLSELGLGRSLTRYDRSVDMHISKLRRKITDEAAGRSPIQTIRGVGYQYVVAK